MGAQTKRTDGRSRLTRKTKGANSNAWASTKKRSFSKAGSPSGKVSTSSSRYSNRPSPGVVMVGMRGGVLQNI
jgi:hypothetical protein